MNNETISHYILGCLRIALGWIFLWPFLDKMFGLGYNNGADNAMIKGKSVTYGFLNFGTGEWFGEFFANMSSADANTIGIVDILFMAGLLGIGLAFILGIGTRIAGYAGFTLMLFMFIAIIPFMHGIDHNPLMDDHIIYGLACLYFGHSDAGSWIGFRDKWMNLSIVKKRPILA